MGLGQQFKNSLGTLVDNINTTGVHYVRCIKPNLEKSSTKYDEVRVSDQLRCQGILEAIRIARAAYPNRLPHADLNDRYQASTPQVPELFSASRMDRLHG
jgi:myosin-5